MSEELPEDPRSKSVEGFIAGLMILAPYFDKGMKEVYFMSAEHDIVHLHVDEDKCPEDSDDGRVLVSLGFMMHDYGWAYYT